MNRITTLFFVCLVLTSCERRQVSQDFSTPEGAILMIEDAYRRRDLEAVVIAKSFAMEARIMASELQPSFRNDPTVVANIAQGLEAAFRAEIAANGFPQMAGVKSSFPKVDQYPAFPDVVVVTETCRYLDGKSSTQKILVGKTNRGWRVLNALN